MPKHIAARVAFGLICVSSLAMFAGCASPSQWDLTIDKVGPTYVPAIQVNGAVQRIAALTISGSPALVAPLVQRVQADGWKARLRDESCIEVDPVGHSLDEVTALSFRVDNGEFGDLKFNVILRPDGKAKT